MAIDPYLGSIYLFAGNFAPRGYLLCQGQLLSIAQNTALFSLLGTTYGGDGQTTFGLPDLRGRAAVGQGTGSQGAPAYQLGEVTGSSSVTLLSTNLPQHTHPVMAALSANSSTAASSVPGSDTRTPAPMYNSTSESGITMSPQMLKPAGGNQPLSTQNPVLAINFIIVTEGVYPARN